MNTPTTLRCVIPCNFGSLRLPPRRHRGFTLVELLLVLAVASVLLGFGIPSMAALTNPSKLTAASNALLSSIQLARSEATRRNRPVVLCKSRDGVSCSASGGWEQGWIVFQDSDGNGERDPAEVLIERGNPLPHNLRLTGSSTVARYVSFVAAGAARIAHSSFQAGTVTVCAVAAADGEARQIVLNGVGRPRVQKVAVAGCA